MPLSVVRDSKMSTKCPTVCVCSSSKVSCRGRGLTSIPPLPQNTKDLDFSDNILNNLSIFTFQNIKELQIENLSLSNCNITDINDDAFKPLSFLRNLDLSRNLLNFRSTVLTVGLRGLNRETIKSLNLSSQEVVNPYLQNDTFDGLSGSGLETILLMDGYLRYIEGYTFSKLQNLTTLNVSDNHIRDVSLKGLSALITLDLSENELYILPSFCNKTKVKYLPRLEFLFLGNNHISELGIPAKYEQCLPRLKELYLEFNPIGYIRTHQFLPLQSLEVVILDYMLVTRILIEKQAFSSPSLKRIRLGAFKHEVTNDQLDIFENCTSLTKLEMTFIKLNQLSDEDLRKLFRPVLNLELLAVRFAYLTYIPSIISEMKNLQLLSFYNNYIGHWNTDTFQQFRNLTYINLSENRITVVNETSFDQEFLNRADKILLRNNPFSCTCDNYWFVNWANKNKQKLEFPDRYECYSPPTLNDRPMSEYNPNFLECRGLKPDEIAGVVAAVALLVFLTVFILYRKYKWHLRYYIYLLRSKKEKYNIIPNDEFKYDAFVAYTSDDRSWVISNLMAVLEGQHNFSLCLHERDFLPGLTILDQISETIKHSRKVILVLSNNFAKSQWCQYEILLAQHRFLEEGGNSLILILLSDIKQKYMTNCLGMLMRTITYISWTNNSEGKKLFWNKVVASMKSSHRNT
ncbi:hypothetical protein FSP39_008885 [Pinctada imbricata]|uniref:TIR domain-containing protein n=1 Tax=Pinctada imbricata TaxID=66713 RepID=A0AA88XQW1_PINIB|nr:hypothetical protein FSP39_008885 [Pinctada imbricata]